MKSFYNSNRSTLLHRHLCCLQDMEETQQGLGPQKKGINALFIIIHFPGGFFHVLCTNKKKNRSGRKISLVPPWRLQCLNNPVPHYPSHDYSFKNIKGSRRHETHVHVIWDTQCKLCMTWTVQIKTYGTYYCTKYCSLLSPVVKYICSSRTLK